MNDPMNIHEEIEYLRNENAKLADKVKEQNKEVLNSRLYYSQEEFGVAIAMFTTAVGCGAKWDDLTAEAKGWYIVEARKFMAAAAAYDWESSGMGKKG